MGHPILNLISLLLFSLSATSGKEHALLVSSLLLVILFLVARRKTPRKSSISRGLIYLLLFILISNLIISKDAYYSLHQALEFATLVIASLMFSILTYPDELSSSLGNFLHPFLGKRGYSIASSAMLSLYMIPRIMQKGQIMLDARKARNMSFMRHPVKTIGEYSESLITSLIDECKVMEEALSSRAFRPDVKRYGKKIRFLDTLPLILTVIFFVWTRVN